MQEYSGRQHGYCLFRHFFPFFSTLDASLSFKSNFSFYSRIYITIADNGNTHIWIIFHFSNQGPVSIAFVHLVARSAKRLDAIEKELETKKADWIRIETSTGLSGLTTADILIICANTNDPLIYPHHISKEKPVIIVMKTQMGFGVDFMLDNHEWHGVAPNNEQTEKALAQLEETLGDY